MADLSVEDKYHLITRNLHEVVGNEEILKKILAQRPLKFIGELLQLNRFILATLSHF